MCPLQASPNRGYAEWQRVSNYDTAPIFSQTAFNTASSFTTPVLDVSRYGYLGGLDQPGGVNTRVTVNWWADSAGTVALGFRTFNLSANISNNVNYRLPNLGPFVTVGWLGFGGVNLNHTCRLIGTNRVHPLEFIPSAFFLIDVTGQAIGASATFSVYPSDYYSGPMRIWLTMTGNTFTLQVSHLIAGGTYVASEATPFTVANGIIDTVAPPGAWRLDVTNGTAAAQTFSTYAQQSLTGST